MDDALGNIFLTSSIRNPSKHKMTERDHGVNINQMTTLTNVSKI